MKALFLSGGAVPYTCSETYVFYMDVRDPRLVRSQDLTFSIIFCQEDFAFTQSSAPPPPLPYYNQKKQKDTRKLSRIQKQKAKPA